MTILFTIGHPNAASALLGLAGASARAEVPFICFFTGGGVQLLHNADVRDVAKKAARSVVCEHSWARYSPDQPPPVEQGSQTDHSSMIGDAERVVSL